MWLRRCCTLLVLVLLGSTAAAAEAPLWELKDLEGKEHRLEDWRGQWVLLKLGTTTCPACSAELEEIDRIHPLLEALEVAVLDIYLREDRYAVKKYWKRKELDYRPVILYDPRGDLIRPYGVSVIPHLFLVDPQGAIAWEATFTGGEELLRTVQSRLFADKPADGG